MKYSIDILGPYPPPFGGVSIHVKRLHEMLLSKGVCSRVYDQYDFFDKSKHVYPTSMQASWWLKYMFKKKPDIVHFHIFSHFQYLYIFLLSYFCSSKIIISIHNEKILLTSSFYRILILTLIRFSKIKKTIAVSEKVYEELISYGVKNTQWIPAYLAPVEISKRKLNGSGAYKVIYNASTLKSKASRDVYSLDMILHLAQHNAGVDFHIFVGEKETDDLIHTLKDLNSFKNTFLYFNENLIDFLQDADVLVRPNRIDAFGISIQEALDLGVPSIASDVCTRSKGTILFPTGNVEELDAILKATLVQNRDQSLEGYQPTEYASEMIKVYESFGVLFDEC